MLADFSAAKLPFRATLMAAALGAAICLPIEAEGGVTLARLINELLRMGGLQGLPFAVVFGAPHGFGFAAVWASRRGGPYGAALVRAWVALLQTELVLLALIVLDNQGEGETRAPYAIIGFAVVSLLFFVHRVASTSVPDHRRDTGFFIRWGALLTAGMFGWFELQWLGGGGGGGAAPGLWLHATLAAAFGLAASVPRER